jgi:hypothetical protein
VPFDPMLVAESEDLPVSMVIQVHAETEHEIEERDFELSSHASREDLDKSLAEMNAWLRHLWTETHPHRSPASA